MQHLQTSPLPLPGKFILTLGISASASLIYTSLAWAQASTPAASLQPAAPAPALVVEPTGFSVDHNTESQFLFPAHATGSKDQGIPHTSFLLLSESTRLFLNRASASPASFSTQATDLLPPTSETQPVAGMISLDNRYLAQETETAPSVEIDEGELDITVAEEKNFRIGFGSILPVPTALEGPTRERSVGAESTILSLASLAGHVRQRLGENQFVVLEGVADPQLLGIDLSYTIERKEIPGAYSVNIFNQRSLSPSLEGGDDEVDLPDEEDPRVHRIGGGFEYAQAVTPTLSLAGAVNYQQVSVRDALFSDDLETVDEEGNQVVVSEDGRDDLLVLSLAGVYDQVEGQDFALDGTRIRFGVDQSIPVGETDVFFNRLMANFTQFVPLRIFTRDPGTFVVNVQTGATFGDVPPYETFNLGGSSTVRGFSRGDVGSGTSFVQATAEYRFPLFDLRVFDAPLGIGGVLFVDYASDLGTADEVIGDPADARDKPGDGLGYGVGIHSTTPFGLVRFEFGLNDDGGSEFHFAIGDRF